ncbi:MAG: FtsX-like permease family protein [Phycisphaerae bacterium]|nr:FtsX-like permease family protein [Phycisphaerae bacterium]
MYKLFLCLRYLFKRRIAFFAIASVWLCSAMVLIVISVMGGFLDLVKARSRGLLGDLVMENSALQGFPFYQEFIDELKRDMPDEIAEATPVILNYGLIRFPNGNITKPVQVVGIRLEETYRVNDFRQGLFFDRYYPGTTMLAPQQVPVLGLDPAGKLVLPPELEAAHAEWRKTATPEDLERAKKQKGAFFDGPGLFYSANWAEEGRTAPGWAQDELPGLISGIDICAKRLPDGDYERYYPRGYQVLLTLLPITPRGTLVDSSPPKVAFRLVDDSSTGVYDIDSLSVYVDFDIIQEYLLMNAQQPEDGPPIPARATQVQIKAKEGVDPYETRDRIRARWDRFMAAHLDQTSEPQLLAEVEIKTWEEKQAKFIQAVEKEKVLVTILFCIISLVAVLLVGCIFYMIVQQKTRDIGIVKSVGATYAGVASIFLMYGAAVGVVGGILGMVTGAIFVHYINDIQDLLTRVHPNLQVWSPEVYTFSRIPNVVKGLDMAVIFAVAILASMAGAVVAATKAARVWPVEALRYE